jgi:thiosulfate/3-mercaptopyruvate sulfurtransferase
MISNKRPGRCAMISGMAVLALLLVVAFGAPSRGQEETPSPNAIVWPPKGVMVRISGDIMGKQIVHQVPPVYPSEARDARVSGSVVLRVVIGMNGQVEAIKPLSGPPLLLKAATDAVKQWSYRPVHLNGRAVMVDTTVVMSFGRTTASPAADVSEPQGQTDPWTSMETVTPADLAKEISDADPAKRPIVACVGFKFLYDGGHVPGALFHGPASKDEGLRDLKQWADGLPKSSNVVLYCGCCPMVRCPNLRPAFTALQHEGFAHLRVLLLPTNFATDWAGKGYPVDKGN